MKTIETKTTLTIEVLGLKQPAILNKEPNTEVIFITAKSFDKVQPKTLSITRRKAESFLMSDFLPETHSNNYTNSQGDICVELHSLRYRPRYYEVVTIYVPNDGEKYGYIGKDGKPIEYKATDCYIIESIREVERPTTLEEKTTNAIEARKIAIALFENETGETYNPRNPEHKQMIKDYL